MTTPDPFVQLDQRRVLRTARRHAGLVAGFLLVGLVGGAAYGSVHKSDYTASSTVLLGDPVSLATVLPGSNDSSTPRSSTAVAASQLAQLSGDITEQRAEKALQNRPTHTLSFSPSTTDPSTVTITAVSPDEQTAVDAANAYAKAYLDGVSDASVALLTATATQLQANIDALATRAQQLEQTLSSTPAANLAQVQAVVGPEHDDAVTRRGILERQLNQVKLVQSVDATGTARLVANANLDTATRTAGASTFVVIGALFGLLLAAFAVAWREARTGAVVDEDDVRLAGLPSRVLRLAVRSPGRPLARADDLLSADDQSRLRVLAAGILPAEPGQGTACLFASADRDLLGTTTLVARLARQIESSGRSVVVVCADPRNAVADQVFGTEVGARGLADLVHGRASLDDLLAEQPGRLRVLPAGRADAGSLTGQLVATSVRELVRRGDTVLVLGRPMAETAEALLLLPATGRLALVARRGRTPRRALTQAQQALHEQFGTATEAEQDVVVLVHGAPRPLRRRSSPQRAAAPSLPRQTGEGQGGQDGEMSSASAGYHDAR